MSAPSGESITSAALREAWACYHATLDEMRAAMEATPRFQATPQHRAKAYHTLMEMQAMAYNFAVAPRLSHPRIYFQSSWQSELHTLGQNCQDLLYGVFFVDGQQRYRLSGRMGDVSLFLLQTHNGLFGEDGVKLTGNYDWADFEIGADGRFEVTLSAEKADGNWIAIDREARFQCLFIRRALPDWHGDPGELQLERISEIADTHYDADEFDEAAMAQRIRRAATFLRYLVNCFNISLYDLYLANAGGARNVLTLLPGTTVSQVGSPTSNYAMALFELAPDEALLIEMDRVLDGVYWSFQLGDVWSRSLDYANRQSSLNLREIMIDSDGGFRVVVAHQDPGISNWLDTCGRVEGTVVFRNYRASTAPVPCSRKVKFDELESLLPQDTRRVTPHARGQTLERRRLGQHRLYGE